jgi:hypothetical protein
LLSLYLDLYFEIWNWGVSRESQYDFGRSWTTIPRIVEQGTTSNCYSKLASDALLSQRKDPALATFNGSDLSEVSFIESAAAIACDF